MREKLIELLETVVSPKDLLCAGEVIVQTAKVADHLIANGVTVQESKVVEIDQFNKWISVTERMPEQEGRYLCVVPIGKSGAVYVQIMNGDRNGFSLEHIYNDDVTHWMPLPEPPKET